MNNVKDQLKAVLEDEKRFTQEMEHNVLRKLEQKNQPKKSWAIGFGVFAFIAASLFFTLLVVERKPEQVTLPQEEIMQLEEQLLSAFHAEMTGSSAELLYHKVGFQKENDAILVYQEDVDRLETVIYEWKNEKWTRTFAASLNTENDHNWAIAGNGPYLLTGIIGGYNINKILINDEVVEHVIINHEVINHPYHYYATFVEEPVNRVVAQYIDNRYERLRPKYVKPLDEIAIVEPEGNQIVVPYKAPTMAMKNNEYMEYPIVVDRTIGTLKRGDVVYFDDQIHEPFVTRIIGLPGESVGIKNSTILINDKPLEDYIGYAKIDGEYVLEGYLNRGNAGESINEAEAKRIFNWNEEPFRVSDRQYVLLGDNWLNSDLSIIDSKYIVGKVIGYNRSDLEKEWSDEEKAVYAKFHQTHDEELLRNLTPIQIARLYFYSSFKNHPETTYYFYTNRPDYIAWSLEEHMKNAQMEQEMYVDLSDYYVGMAKQLTEGTFIQTSDENGYISFDQGMTGFQLVKNEKGIWQVGFMPIQ